MLLNVGFGNFVSEKRIITIVSPDSSPIKRLMHLAKERGVLIDASCGRKTQAVIVMDSGHVVLSALTSETLFNKVSKCDVEELNTLSFS